MIFLTENILRIFRSKMFDFFEIWKNLKSTDLGFAFMTYFGVISLGVTPRFSFFIKRSLRPQTAIPGSLEMLRLRRNYTWIWLERFGSATKSALIIE